MKVKTRDLTGIALDWAVALCLGQDEESLDPTTFLCTAWPSGVYSYSSRWSQGGPLIESEGMTVGRSLNPGEWSAEAFSEDGTTDYVRSGATPLIAAMRCLVASHIGDEIEVPEELA